VHATSGVEGVEELREAVTAVGLIVDTSLPEDAAADLILVNPAGGRITAQVKRMSLASIDGLERRIRQWDAHADPKADVRVVVADRVTEQARQLLRAAGWSWLDLRGHLHLAGEGLFVDTDVPRLREPPDRSTPLAGRVGTEVAALLLLDPTRSASIRDVARTLGRSPSSVSQVLTSMRAAGLVDEHRKPTIPELFWELAEHWHPVQSDVRLPPSPGSTAITGSVNEALRLGLDNDVETTTGWALTDTVAAAAYGAPVGARADYPPDFYVPDQAILRRATHLLGAAQRHEDRGATIRVAPISVICARRIDWEGETWPLARPLFIALDLAKDPGRGHEVLQTWTPPPEAGTRVW
jgi:hypothetical protein